MAGVNPYIETNAQPPRTKYHITFLPSGKVFEVDPEKLPYGRHGLPGSILDISEAAGVELQIRPIAEHGLASRAIPGPDLRDHSRRGS